MAGLRFFQAAPGAETNAVFAFCESFLTEFLWPRTIDELESMADDGQLFAAADSGRILACCYMKPLGPGDINDVLRRVINVDDAYEFGGVLVDDAARGKKIGSTLGRMSLAVVSSMASPSGIIAHVHEENDLPRPLLERLGFGVTGEKDGPPFAPPGMKDERRGQGHWRRLPLRLRPFRGHRRLVRRLCRQRRRTTRGVIRDSGPTNDGLGPSSVGWAIAGAPCEVRARLRDRRDRPTELASIMRPVHTISTRSIA